MFRRGERAARKVLKAGLPKREPLVWSAGWSCWRAEILERMLRRAVIVGCWIWELMVDIGTSRTESVMEKMKEVMRVYVGEARKSSWSFGERIRRVGCWKVMLGGTGGNEGVSGAGLVGRGVELVFRRGVSFGSFFDRSGGFDGICSPDIGRCGVSTEMGILGA